MIFTCPFRDLLHIKRSDRPIVQPVFLSLLIAISLVISLSFLSINAGLTLVMANWSFVHLSANKEGLKIKNSLLICAAFLLFFLVGLAANFLQIPKELFLFTCAGAATYVSLYLNFIGPRGLFLFIVGCLASYKMVDSIVSIINELVIFSFGLLVTMAVSRVYQKLFNRYTFISHRTVVQIVSLKKQFFEIIVVSLATSVAFLLASKLNLDKPHWASITSFALFQASSLETVWLRKIQRIIGTLIGVVLLIIFLNLDFGLLGSCIFIVMSVFLLEFFVTKNYLIGSIFITTLTLAFVDLSSGLENQNSIIWTARIYDTLIGSFVAMIGAFFLYESNLKLSLTKFSRTLMAKLYQIIN